MRRYRLLTLWPRASALCFFLPAILSAAPWVAITEIHYHPPEGESLEFVEIYNREPPRADLSGWRLEGEVSFRFPEGTLLGTTEYALIAKDPSQLRKRCPAGARVFGPFRGRLDNKGGRITLRNAAGARVAEVRYRSGGKWPTVPDGTGHTLSLLDPVLSPRDPRSWAPSSRLGGTPGAKNFSRTEAPSLPIVKRGETWRFFRGKRPVAPRWRELSFGDDAWESGPSGFGYGDNDDQTVLEDMRGQYLSVYTRKVFEAPDLAAPLHLILRVDYDDGFIAYLNGTEIARANMGPEGREAAYDVPASGKHEAGVPTEIDLGPASRSLRAGKNILAVEGHNASLDSTDLSLAVELEGRKPASAEGRKGAPMLNEILRRGVPDAQGSASSSPFVEIFNAGGTEMDLGGYFLSDDPHDLKKFKIPAPKPLKPRGFALLSARELGEGFSFTGPSLFLTLTMPDGEQVADALKIQGDISRPRGRFPDGSSEWAVLEAATPGAANTMKRVEAIVINEIMYHPVSGEDDAYLEVFNRGSEEISLRGFRLTGEMRFEFGENDTLRPGAFVVIARSPEALAAKYGLQPREVLGPFQGHLSRKGGEITLRDPSGNVADRVEYADRDPWPKWADGLGSSLELIDPWLDNSLPGSWAASDEGRKAKWEAFHFVKGHRSFEGRNVPEIQFMLLSEGECLIDDLHVTGEKDLLTSTFEQGSPLEKKGLQWAALGTHERSGPCQDEAFQGQGSFRIVADGRGNARHNYVSFKVPGGLTTGKKYEVSFQAKWQRGAGLLLARTVGQGVSKAVRLGLPERPGTPGTENSARNKQTPPVVGIPRQEPVSPSTLQPVSISVPISSLTPLQAVNVHYRRDGDPEWQQVPLSSPEGALDSISTSGTWRGQIPAMTAKKVEFYVSAKDAGGKVGTFPPGAPLETALYAVGLLSSPKFPTFTLLVSSSEWEAMGRRPRLSNRLARGTFVYGDSRIFYNVGFRRRGSPFTRSSRNWRVVFGAENLDGRRSMTLDGQGGDGTRLNERLTYWMIEQLRAPNVRQEYVYFRLLGHEEGVYEDVEKVDGDFLASWFEPKKGKMAETKALPPREPGPRRGKLHKVDDYFELFSGGDQAYREADLVFKTLDPEDYRWNFPPRANGSGEDFKPLLELLCLLDSRKTPDRAFDEEIEKVVDVDEWLKVLAARTLVDDWDTLGRRRGKNCFLYLSGDGQRWRLVPWDCDLAWQDPSAPLFSDRFEGIRRILMRPTYRRRFLGYLAYLAERKMAPAVFDVALKDLQAYCGAATEPFLRFAELRRPNVRDQIPRCSFKITETRRVERAGEPDLLVASGTAPAIALRFRLNHAEGKARFLDEARWSAEFPVGPEGGEALLQALDFGGNEVARAMVDVKARPSALSIPAQEPEYVEEKIDQDGTRGPAPGATAEWEGEEVEKEPSSHPEAFPHGAERLLSKTSPQSAAALKTSAWGQSALLLSLFGVTLLGALWIWRQR